MIKGNRRVTRGPFVKKVKKKVLDSVWKQTA